MFADNNNLYWEICVLQVLLHIVGFQYTALLSTCAIALTILSN